MAISSDSGGTVITGKEDIDLFMLMAAASRLNIELSTGLRFKGPSTANQLKARFGWTGSKQRILSQLEDEIARRKAERG